MTSSEFSDWQEYASIKPFGVSRDNLHAALIAKTIADVHRTPEEAAYTLDDFMLKTNEQRESDADRDSIQSLMAFMLQISGKKDG